MRNRLVLSNIPFDSMEDDNNIKTFLDTLKSQDRDYGVQLPSATAARLGEYYRTLEGWNSRLHLVAPCSPAEFATRHVLESLFLLHHLPPEATIVDVGSGAGLPIIPCLIVRGDLCATLVESSKKKTIFLREVLKRTGIANSATVVAEQFQQVARIDADFLTCRALDRFEAKLADIIAWSSQSSTLLLYGGNSLGRKLDQLAVNFKQELLPNSDQRFLFIAQRS